MSLQVQFSLARDDIQIKVRLVPCELSFMRSSDLRVPIICLCDLWGQSHTTMD